MSRQKHATVRKMTARCFFLAIASPLTLMLMQPAVAATDDSIAVEEAEFRIRLEIDAPASLRQTLQNGLDISRWQDYGNMTMPLLRSLVRDAREEALEAAATEGYYNAAVDVSIDELHGDTRRVLLKLSPGDPIHVANVSISLTGAIDPAAELRVRELWGLAPGETFRQSTWEAAKNAALTEIARTLYAATSVAESQAVVDPVKGSADLKLVLDTGPAFAFGPITVTGLSKYPATTVTNLSPFRTGDPYGREPVEVFLRRLNATNYFSSVHVVVDDNRSLAAAAPVRVAVIEAPTRRLEAGVGYSTDTLYRTTASWRNVNLLDSALRFNSELRLETNLQQLGATSTLR